MKIVVVITLIFVAIAGQSMADGKMFMREEVPPGIPYQRAFILFDKGVETLILQSKYEIPGGDNETILGWVVPVPAEPEVASMPAYEAESLFDYLAICSNPTVTRIGPIVVYGFMFFLFLGLPVLVPLFCLLPFIFSFPRLFRYSMWGLILYVLIVAIFLSVERSTLGMAGVEVVKEQQVGIYDVSVVRSDDATELIDWLNRHDFKFDDRDTIVFDSYVSKGWCFVVAIINPNTEENRIAFEGLAAPLILRFPHPNPIYPVALTGSGGFETEILVYLASSTKMKTADSLTLRFARKMGNDPARKLSSCTVDPKGFFDTENMSFPYLCKFKDRLTPDKMSADIVFSEAGDTKMYREHIFKW